MGYQPRLVEQRLFSTEARFYLNGVVNIQNVSFWAVGNLYVIHEKVLDALRVTVSAAISSQGIIRSFCFKKTVNSERYLTMLRNRFVPELIANKFQNQGFTLDGAAPHTADVVLDYLHQTFDAHSISKLFPVRFECGKNWSPNSSFLVIHAITFFGDF